MFALIKDGVLVAFPYRFRDLRVDHPQTSLPRNMTVLEAKQYGVEKVVEGPRPLYDGRTQKISIQKTPTFDGEKWILDWIVTPLTQAEIDATYVKLEANIRKRRDAKLLETDFVILRHTEAGTPIPQAWIDYRQHLRDVTAQPEYPYRVAFWPKPTV